MANTITAKYVDNTTSVLTVASYDKAQAIVLALPKNGLFTDDAGVSHPASAIVSLTVA